MSPLLAVKDLMHPRRRNAGNDADSADAVPGRESADRGLPLLIGSGPLLRCCGEALHLLSLKQFGCLEQFFGGETELRRGPLGVVGALVVAVPDGGLRAEDVVVDAVVGGVCGREVHGSLSCGDRFHV